MEGRWWDRDRVSGAAKFVEQAIGDIETSIGIEPTVGKGGSNFAYRGLETVSKRGRDQLIARIETKADDNKLYCRTLVIALMATFDMIDSYFNILVCAESLESESDEPEKAEQLSLDLF